MATIDTIRAYYADILQRSGSEVSDAEINFYVSAVDSGRISLGEVRSAFINSPEGQDVQDVVRLYQAVFGRVPDKDGLNFQVDTLRGAGTGSDLASSFAASPEFAARFGGTEVTIDFVNSVYQNVLGRTATFAELDFYLTSGFTAERIVLAFSESPEFVSNTQAAVSNFLDAAGQGTANYNGSLGGGSNGGDGGGTPTTPIPPVTPGPDNVAPTFVSPSSPADGATNVAADANIVLTYSEAIKAGTGNIVLTNQFNASDTRTIAVTDSQVTFSGNTVTINPTSNLQVGATYNVTFAAGVIEDLAGNDAAGFTNAGDLNFTVPATSGDDTIVVGVGSGTVSGLAGNDTFQVGSNAALAGTTLDGGTGTDTLAITASGVTIAAAPNPTLTAIEQLNVANFGVTIATTVFDDFTKVDGSGLITFSDDGNVTLLSGSTASNFQLAAGGQTFNASAVSTAVAVAGNTGDDTITGGAGADTITGGSGVDTITGGAGADTMNGGAGADVFNYGTLASVSSQTGATLVTADTIGDFVSGTDTIKTGTAGSGSNYVEAVAAADFATAESDANGVFDGTVRYYLTNTVADGGLLFIDSDGDNTADAVIRLTGITAANFAETDIVA